MGGQPEPRDAVRGRRRAEAADADALLGGLQHSGQRLPGSGHPDGEHGTVRWRDTTCLGENRCAEMHLLGKRRVAAQYPQRGRRGSRGRRSQTGVDTCRGDSTLIKFLF